MVCSSVICLSGSLSDLLLSYCFFVCLFEGAMAVRRYWVTAERRLQTIGLDNVVMEEMQDLPAVFH